jgi:single-stranded-DNA-specific exonuclease
LLEVFGDQGELVECRKEADMAKVWKLPLHDAARIATVANELRVPAVLAQLLLNRGITEPAGAKDFLDASLKGLHDPALLPGATDAARRIVQAVRDRRRIVIYGDYDVDGVTGSAILIECLRLAAADVRFYVPHRLEEGYGLNAAALETIRGDEQADMVVTVDCGIASVAEAEAARTLGIELIVTDHHEFAEQLPRADCLVHPRLPGGAYPFRELSGAGVAFKLAWAIAQQLEGAARVSPQFREFLLQAVSLAALGAVADVVPLCGENRVLVRHGLVSLKERPSIGLRELMAAAELADAAPLDAEDIAFRLAPRINAAGRLGQARLAVELLTTRNQTRAREIAQYLNGQNEQRQTLERRIFKEAKELLDAEHDMDRDRVIVIGKREWHAGVIGIVAGRMVERFWRPAVLVSLDGEPGQGSGRSIPGFNLHEALHACGEWLEGYGGHAMAAGVKIRPENLVRFRAAMCEYAAARLSPQDLVEHIRIDAEVSLGDVSPRLVGAIERLAPFGAGNRRPLLMAASVELSGPPQAMGGGDRHLSFRIRQNGTAAVRAVAFGMAERAPELVPGSRYDVVFSPQLNTYQGLTRVDLHVKDFRPCLPQGEQKSSAKSETGAGQQSQSPQSA